ncbi:G-protein coupled receptor 22-like [Phascolarctos cinereus]|uniref:Probable G-protein coupled receptor 22 n=1 Tax=Phascolarctos cinereus TaxID=38626 RepID=A0A6P5L9G4_PHACI|nr:probable G-protein coupled receptor 22 [Phascolarctos cinereus]XP_020854708.1 probable G-protein coupled receptor 22 [Phascolarctos cinereus]XP_020854710.1 probable G-protein coupled receptor 22 [Phascolarctos cinereus]XP_020854711.1 probable G-protein coupled receptor 22 [Phascolarctos cinereus]
METHSDLPVLETSDGPRAGAAVDSSEDAGWARGPFPGGFRASLAGVLLLELALGLGCNTAALLLHRARAGPRASASARLTLSLHVLDTLICAFCVPLSVAVLLLPTTSALRAPVSVRPLSLLCRFHEAGVTFSGVATAAGVLAVSLDRYDMSARPARRRLTPARALLLLAIAWLLSLAAFFLPFVEAGLAPGAWDEASGADNRTDVSCVGTGGDEAVAGRGEPAGRGHLLVQIPAFVAALVGLLVTYARVLHALSAGVGARASRRRRRGRRRGRGCGSGAGAGESRGLSPMPPPAAPTSGPAPPPPALQTSVSVILALRRAVRRHRDRRARRRRVLRRSLLIVSSFVGCWAPLSVGNLLLLCMGPSERLARLRLCCLAAAYGTTVLHPLLYAFPRRSLSRALRSQARRHAVCALRPEPPAPAAAIVRNSWLRTRKGQGKAEEVGDRGLGLDGQPRN